MGTPQLLFLTASYTAWSGFVSVKTPSPAHPWEHIPRPGLPWALLLAGHSQTTTAFNVKEAPH